MVGTPTSFKFLAATTSASEAVLEEGGVREAVVTFDIGVVDDAAAISGDVTENRFLLCDSILPLNEEESLDRIDCKLAVTRPVVVL